MPQSDIGRLKMAQLVAMYQIAIKALNEIADGDYQEGSTIVAIRALEEMAKLGKV